MSKPPFGAPGLGGSLGICALCGQNFLTEILLGKSVKSFTLDAVNNTLYAHDVCITQYGGKDVMELPITSPLRQKYEQLEDEKEKGGGGGGQ